MSGLQALTRELFETPMNIGGVQFAANDPEFGPKWLEALKAEPDYRGVGAYKGVPIYAAGHYFFTEEGGALSFFVKWTERVMPGQSGKSVTQVAVERGPRAPEGMASYVFWHFLMELRGAVMTDNAQTAQGKKFWDRQVYLALRSPLAHVYIVDLTNNSFQEVGDDYAYERGVTLAYGDQPASMDHRVLITTRSIEGATRVAEGSMSFLVHCL